MPNHSSKSRARPSKKSASKTSLARAEFERSLYNIVQLPVIMPNRMRTKLVYSSFKSFTGITTSLGQQLVTGNDLFDPDETGVGHQPIGYDQWCPGFYRKFRVVASKIYVTAINDTTVNTMVVVYPIDPNAPGAYPTHIHDAAEQPNAVVRYLTPYTPPTDSTIVHHFRTADVFGVPYQAVLDEDNFAANYNATPSALWVWVINAQNVNETTSSNITITYRVEYDAILYDRVTLQES